MCGNQAKSAYNNNLCRQQCPGAKRSLPSYPHPLLPLQSSVVLLVYNHYLYHSDRKKQGRLKTILQEEHAKLEKKQATGQCNTDTV